MNPTGQEPPKNAELVINELGPPIDASVFLLDNLKRYDIAIPPEASTQLAAFMRRALVGSMSVLPMCCKGDTSNTKTSCPFLSVCPLHRANLALPIGKMCPVEMAMLDTWIARMKFELKIEEVTPDNADQVELVYEIAASELLRYRANAHLHSMPHLIADQIVGYSPQGQPIHDIKINPAMLINERLTRQILKLKSSLLFTPESQLKAGRLVGDPSTAAAKLREQLQQKIEERRKAAKDADYTVEEKPGA